MKIRVHFSKLDDESIAETLRSCREQAQAEGLAPTTIEDRCRFLFGVLTEWGRKSHEGV